MEDNIKTIVKVLINCVLWQTLFTHFTISTRIKILHLSNIMVVIARDCNIDVSQRQVIWQESGNNDYNCQKNKKKKKITDESMKTRKKYLFFITHDCSLIGIFILLQKPLEIVTPCKYYDNIRQFRFFVLFTKYRKWSEKMFSMKQTHFANESIFNPVLGYLSSQCEQIGCKKTDASTIKSLDDGEYMDSINSTRTGAGKYGDQHMLFHIEGSWIQ